VDATVRAGGLPARDSFGRLLDGVDCLSQLGGWAAVVSTLAILALICAEVIARNVFNYSISFAWEFSAYFMGAAIMLGAGYSLRAGAQIRVNVLIETTPAAVGRWLDVTATLIAAVTSLYLTAACSQLAWLSWIRNSRSVQPSDLPLWIPQIVLALGALLLTLQTFARLARLLRREPPEDRRLKVGQDVE
jgi:C4-dicarboxylate transporter, DctQ subunit